MHFSDLKEVKRSRLVAAALAFLLCLFCIVRLYAMTFPYANTAKGLQQAVEDYVPSPDDTDATQGTLRTALCASSVLQSRVSFCMWLTPQTMPIMYTASSP